MTQTPATNRQIPDNSIMDFYNKQVYLGNQFVLAINNPTIGSTSETPLALLVNPLASKVGLFSVYKKFSCLTSASTGVLKFYTGPTYSVTGSASTLANLRPANLNASQALAYEIGSFSVSNNGTLISVLVANAYSSDESSLLSILDPGQSLLVTAQASSSAQIALELSHYEI